MLKVRLEKMRLMVKTITILLTLLPVLACAETVTWQEPIILQLNLDKPGVYESSPIPTEGIIKEVTANWDFQGEVSIEISADGGIHFTPLVNGIPQKEGIAIGNQLCYKVNIGEGGSISNLTLTYSDTSGVEYTFGNPRLAGFSFRKPIHISGLNTGNLFNYPIKIIVGEEKDVDCGGKTLPNFNDIRFTAADGETLLAHYHYKDSATFWVRVPQIPPEGTMIYIYYGNPKAQEESRGDEVFAFFDDFSQAGLDEEKWEFIPDLRGQGYIKDGQLFLKDSTIRMREFIIEPGLLIEFKARAESNHVAIQAALPELVFYSSSFEGAQHAIAKEGRVKVNKDSPLTAGDDYIYSIGGFGKEVLFTRQHNEEVYSVGLTDETKEAARRLGLKITTAYGAEQGAYLDWIRIRPCSEPEPRILSVGEEFHTNLAQPVKSDCYISQVVSADFPVRIMTVRDDIQMPKSLNGWRLSLSANAGKNYSGGIMPGRYYYVSKGDFVTGQSLRWRINARSEYADGLLPERITLSYFPGTITLISPDGKGVLAADSRQEIRWSAEEYESDYPLRLEFSQDNGATFKLIAEGFSNTGSFIWQLPQDLKGEILIKISDFYAPEVFDVSDMAVEIE
jgi:hypothetical protein